MGRLKFLAPVLIAAQSACVTGGGPEKGIFVGSAVVYSVVAQDASAGNKGAKNLWCGTLGLVKAQLSLPGGAKSEDALVEELTPGVHDIARQSGYQLHRTQIRTLILDAHKVASDDKVYADYHAKECQQ